MSTYRLFQDIGEVESIDFKKSMKLWDGSESEGVEVSIRSSIAVSDASLGCSIAVNGVCLTATSFDHEKVIK